MRLHFEQELSNAKDELSKHTNKQPAANEAKRRKKRRKAARDARKQRHKRARKNRTY